MVNDTNKTRNMPYQILLQVLWHFIWSLKPFVWWTELWTEFTSQKCQRWHKIVMTGSVRCTNGEYCVITFSWLENWSRYFNCKWTVRLPAHCGDVTYLLDKRPWKNLKGKLLILLWWPKLTVVLNVPDRIAIHTQCEVEMGFMCPLVPGCIEPPLTSFVSDGRVLVGLQVTLWLSLFYCVTIRAYT